MVKAQLESANFACASVHRALAEAGVSASDVDAVAVTDGPGLTGALLVGLAAAKA